MGSLFAIVASLLVGLYPPFQNVMMFNGTSPLDAVIACLGFTGLFSLIIALVKGETVRIAPRTFGAFLLAGIVGLLLTNYLLAVAYALMPVGFATMIHFMYPTVVCLVMSLAFKQGFTLRKLGAMLFIALDARRKA